MAVCMSQDPDLSITSLRRRNSTGVFVGSHLPHLICMDDDILSTGIKLYHLKVCTPSYIHMCTETHTDSRHTSFTCLLPSQVFPGCHPLLRLSFAEVLAGYLLFCRSTAELRVLNDEYTRQWHLTMHTGDSVV